MPDPAIEFTEDASAAASGDWLNAIARTGLPIPAKKEQIALRVDADVIAWFRGQGAGCQARMNAVLKAYAQNVGQQNTQNTRALAVPTKGRAAHACTQ